MNGRHNAWGAWGWIALLVAVCLAYGNSLQNGFHFDDIHTVVDNPAVRSLRNVPRFFTDATTFSVLPPNRTYRPVVSTSLAVDYALGRGYDPLWFHLSTLIVFLALIALLRAFYRYLLDKIRPSPANEWLALFAAAWFGLHPAMAETVNYVIQRGDIYCTFGCVAALFIFARYPHLRRTGLYLAPLTFALLSKPPAAVFPALLFLYLFFFDRPRSYLIAMLPSTILTGLLLWLQSAMTPKSFLASAISPWDYRLVQPFVWLRYFGSLFLPLHLNMDSDLMPFATFDLRAFAGLLFLAALCTAIWFTARRRPLYPIAFGLLWFVVTQLPTSLYPLSEVENDHRMFFSFVGLTLSTVWAAWLLLLRLTTPARRVQLRPAIAAVAVLVLTGYAYGVHTRNAVWRDEETLWRDDVQKSPHNGRGLMMYGLTQMDKGAYATALDYFQRALVYTPNYATLEINLGVANGSMANQGDSARTAEAERHFQRAIALAPNDDLSRAFYGRWLNDHGRSAEAIDQLRSAVALNPQRLMQRELLIDAYNRSNSPGAARMTALDILAIAPSDTAALQTLAHPPTQSAGFWINLSLSQYRLGQYQQSIDSARHALQLDPNSAEASNNIAAGYGALQQWDEAIRNAREALRLKPDFQLAQNNLHWYLQQQASGPSVPADTPRTAEDFLNQSVRLNQAGKYLESIAAARSALKLRPSFAEAWNNIAANDEAMHHWDEAIIAAQKAIALKPDFQLAKNNLAWSLSQKKLQIH